MEARIEHEREGRIPHPVEDEGLPIDAEEQWTLPPFPPELVRAAEIVWSERSGNGGYADRERLFSEISIYAYDLRRAGVPRDRVVAAVWPLFVGAASSHLIEDALDRCMSAYDVAPDTNH